MMKHLKKQDWILIAFNVVGVAFNVGWALAFPDNYFTFMNWIAVGGCTALAFTQPILSQWRAVVDDQSATIIASNAAIEAVSPAHMQTMLHGALTAVVEQMKRDGVLPPDAQISIDQDNLPKSFH